MGYKEDSMKSAIEKLEHLMELGGIKKDIIILVISGIAVLCSLFGFTPFPFDMAWIAIILCGVPIVLEAVIGLITAFDIKADVLVSLALIASVCIGEDFAAGEVAFIMQLGALLEELTVARARAGIEKLVHLTPQTARIIRGGKEETIPAERVCVGDLIRVLPGESVPVDGVIVSGQTSISKRIKKLFGYLLKRSCIAARVRLGIDILTIGNKVRELYRVGNKKQVSGVLRTFKIFSCKLSRAKTLIAEFDIKNRCRFQSV